MSKQNSSKPIFSDLQKGEKNAKTNLRNSEKKIPLSNNIKKLKFLPKSCSIIKLDDLENVDDEHNEPCVDGDQSFSGLLDRRSMRHDIEVSNASDD